MSHAGGFVLFSSMGTEGPLPTSEHNHLEANSKEGNEDGENMRANKPGLVIAHKHFSGLGYTSPVASRKCVRGKRRESRLRSQ